MTVSRAVCWVVRRAEMATSTTWPQWPLWLQRFLLWVTE